MTSHECGTCTACCHTIPVEEIGLRAYQGCPHEMGMYHMTRGCRIYSSRPISCRGWSCLWLLNHEWQDELRPDRCGVVFDEAFDTARVENPETGVVVERLAAQAWVERGHEERWKDNPHVWQVIQALIHRDLIVLMRQADGLSVSVFLYEGKIAVTDPQPADPEYSKTPRLERIARLDQARR